MARRPMRTGRFMQLTMILAGSLLLWGCAATPSPLESVANEGLAIMKRINFESPPEAKVHIAQELVKHALRYDQPIDDAAAATSLEAARFRQNERAAAATLMREAAEDYEAQGQRDRAHGVYELILRTFTDEREAHIRQSADTELSRLSGQQRPPAQRALP